MKKLKTWVVLSTYLHPPPINKIDLSISNIFYLSNFLILILLFLGERDYNH